MVFYNWADGQFVHKIDVTPEYPLERHGHAVHPRVRGHVARAQVRRGGCDGGARRGNPSALTDDGVEGAFEFLHEVSDKVTTGQWVGDCFLFTNAANRLNYFVGGEIMTMCHLDHTMYMLGYLAKEDRVFLIDNSHNVVSFRVLLTVLQFQTAVVRQDMDEANLLIK